MLLLCIAPTGYNISSHLLNGLISINHGFRSSIHKASQQKLRVILCSPSVRLHSKISRGIELDIISKDGDSRFVFPDNMAAVALEAM